MDEEMENGVDEARKLKRKKKMAMAEKTIKIMEEEEI